MPPTALAVGAFRPWILRSHPPLGAPLPCKRTNGTGYYGCCKRGDTTRKGQSALLSGASSLAFFNLKPSFHGRDDVLSLSMTWNVHIIYIYISSKTSILENPARFDGVECWTSFSLVNLPSISRRMAHPFSDPPWHTNISVNVTWSSNVLNIDETTGIHNLRRTLESYAVIQIHHIPEWQGEWLAHGDPKH